MAHLNFAYADKLFVRYQLAEQEAADAIVIFGGWPGDYANKNSIEFLREQGYHVFSPLYAGIYQSEGGFLETNPVTDYEQLINQLKKGVIDNLYTNEQEHFTVNNIYFLGSSFGGSIALGAASTYNPQRLVLLAPVWDWSKQEGLNEEVAFAKRAFKHVYRLGFRDEEEMLERLTNYQELQPSHYTQHVNCPVLVLHDPEDDVVPYKQTQEMKERLAFTELLHEYGHSMSEPLQAHWGRVEKFLN